VLVALVTLAIALPWLLFNSITFGSPVPQSGWAESVAGIYSRGRATQALAVMAATAGALTPAPIGLTRFPEPVRLAISLVVLCAWGAAARHAVRRGTPQFAATLSVLSSAVAGLVAVYSVAFGAPWMAGRWLTPAIVPGILVCTPIITATLGARSRLARTTATLALGVVVSGMGVRVAVDSRIENPTNTWPMLKHVQDAAWNARPIGSFQSGLLAWALPDVVNLDGKVNPGALKALRSGEFPAWVGAQGPEILMDWDYFGFDAAPEVVRKYRSSPGPAGMTILLRQ
jgi:hypothetical protein